MSTRKKQEVLSPKQHCGRFESVNAKLLAVDPASRSEAAAAKIMCCELTPREAPVSAPTLAG